MKSKLKIVNILLTSTILASSVFAEGDLFPEEEQRVGYYYNGQDVFEEFSKTVVERGVRRNIREARLGIPRHKGEDTEVVCVSLHDTGIGLPINISGVYQFEEDLQVKERLPYKGPGTFFYSDGTGKYFYATPTQERWSKEDHPVKALVVSYNKKDQVFLNSEAELPQGILSQGLYNLTSVKDAGRGQKTQTWDRLDQQGEIVEKINITLLRGRSLIPGMDYMVPYSIGKVRPEADALSLTRFINSYIMTEGNRRLMSYARQVFLRKGGTDVSVIRDNISGAVQRAKALSSRNFTSAVDFYVRFNKIFGDDIFKSSNSQQAFRQLDFLRSEDPSLSFPVDQWIRSFSMSLGKLEKLAKKPSFVTENDTLVAKGSLVALSDIREKTRSMSRTINHIKIYGLHSVFLDSNIHSPGGSLSIFSPNWNVHGTPKINLSGQNGSKGENGKSAKKDKEGNHGQPGMPGSDGGVFHGKGKVFRGMHRLEIDVSGGNGGKGGNGSDGSKGIDGKDGNLRKVTKKGKEELFKMQNRRYKKWGKKEYHEDKGHKGQKGCDGGKAGKGGAPGDSGTLEIDGFNWQKAVLSPKAGKDGVAGKGGDGGKHGRDCDGVIFVASDRDAHGSEVIQEPQHLPLKVGFERAKAGKKPSKLNSGSQEWHLGTFLSRLSAASMQHVCVEEDHIQYKDYFESEARKGHITGLFTAFESSR